MGPPLYLSERSFHVTFHIPIRSDGGPAPFLAQLKVGAPLNTEVVCKDLDS